MKVRSTVAAGIVLVGLILGAAGCSSDDGAITKASDSGTTIAAGDSGSASTSAKSDTGRLVDHSKELPAKGRYGYLEVTLERAGLSTKDPETYGISRELEPGEALAVLSVKVENLTEEYTWSVPHSALFHLEAGAEKYQPVSTTSFELKGSAKDSQQMIFVVPGDTNIDKGALVLQEHANDPDTRTRPVRLGVDGTATKDFKAIETDKIDGATFDLKSGSGDLVCGTVTVDKVVIDDSFGLKKNGAVLPAKLPDGLGRPRDGQLFAIVIGSATKQPNVCGLATDAAVPRLTGPDGNPINPIANDATSVNSWSPEPTPDVWIFPVDQTQRDLTFTVLEKYVYTAKLPK